MSSYEWQTDRRGNRRLTRVDGDRVVSRLTHESGTDQGEMAIHAPDPAVVAPVSTITTKVTKAPAVRRPRAKKPAAAKKAAK